MRAAGDPPTISINAPAPGLAVSSDSRVHQSVDGKRSRGDAETDDEDDEPAVGNAKKTKTTAAAKKVLLASIDSTGYISGERAA